MNQAIQYSIVVPVYNEEEVIQETYRRLTEVMCSTGEAYELLFVNDGSKDKTADIIKAFCKKDDAVILLDFSRNFGHQIAITAGMDYAKGNAVVVMDADLQDPPELILAMIEKWKQGYDLVYAQRTKRKGETFLKKLTAKLFYRFLRLMTDIDIPLDTGDFRLLDRKVCDQLSNIQEKNRFVRGLVSWVGFKQIAIEYERDERFAGESKYPFKKMLKLSIDGIASFSFKPLKLAGYAGMIFSSIGFIYAFVILYLKTFTENAIQGWSLLIAIQIFFSGIILFILGIMGEYIGRIYDETKHRPLYIVQEIYHQSVPSKKRMYK